MISAQVQTAALSVAKGLARPQLIEPPRVQMYIQRIHRIQGDDMSSTVQKWGNSLGIRVPKAIAEQVDLKTGTKIEFDTSEGVLTIRPVRRRRRSKHKLSELLAKWKGPYPHKGVFDDAPVGKELI
jgi:antitoxin MazE